MPYIKQEDRQKLALGFKIENAGELNYSISNLILKYLNTHNANYQTYNDILGALEGAKLEFVRSILSPYEDKKIKENGKLY